MGIHPKLGPIDYNKWDNWKLLMGQLETKFQKSCLSDWVGVQGWNTTSAYDNHEELDGHSSETWTNRLQQMGQLETSDGTIGNQVSKKLP